MITNEQSKLLDELKWRGNHLYIVSSLQLTNNELKPEVLEEAVGSLYELLERMIEAKIVTIEEIDRHASRLGQLASKAEQA